MFKKILMVLGAVFVAQVLAVAAGWGYLYLLDIRMNKESADYADDAAAAIAANWSFDQLETRVHPQFFVTTPKDKAQKAFETISSIGEMKSFSGCLGNASTQYAIRPGITAITSASYVCNAEFEKGPATIKLTLLKDPEKGWQIINLNVDSKFFAPHVNNPAKSEP